MKALFLDRDGVINVDYGYVCCESRLKFIDETVELIKVANSKNVPVIVITNQSGIARGFYTEHQHSLFSSFLRAKLFMLGAYIQDYLYCPFLPNASQKIYSQSSSIFRKPNPGLIDYAISIYNLTPSDCIFIGDNSSDMEAAIAAKLGYPLLFSTDPDSQYATIHSPLEAVPFL